LMIGGTSSGRYGRGVRLLVTPFLAGVAAMVVLPAVVSALFAFTDYRGFSTPRWVGLDTFRNVLADPELRTSMKATGGFLIIALPARVAGSLFLALLANGRSRLAGMTRLAVYTPAVIPEPATALVWLWIVNPYCGPVGTLVRLFGGTPSPVLLDPWGARMTVAALSTFALGEGFLVMLAARREVSPTLYDAARCEGARPLAQFRHITFPLVAPTLALLAARDLLTSMQSALVPTLLLTHGGPLGATTTLPLFVYERGFIESRLGEAAALSVLLTMAGLGVLGLLLLVRLWHRRTKRILRERSEPSRPVP
jgi:multiple sugar transport system permease protein